MAPISVSKSIDPDLPYRCTRTCGGGRSRNGVTKRTTRSPSRLVAEVDPVPPTHFDGWLRVAWLQDTTNDNETKPADHRGAKCVGDAAVVVESERHKPEAEEHDDPDQE